MQNRNVRSKQNGFDFGVSIGGGSITDNSSTAAAVPPLAAAGSNMRRSGPATNQQHQQRPQQQQPDLTSAIESALRNGNLHVANRGLIVLPWLKMFPKTDEEVERELRDEEERRKQRMMVGDGKPHPHNTIARFGRKRIDHSVDFDMKNTENQLKWWEGHPIVQIDCSSNNLQSLVDDFDDLTKKHVDRFARLGDNLKILQSSRNSLASLPSFQGFSVLASLDISRNQLFGDLVVTLAMGNEKYLPRSGDEGEGEDSSSRRQRQQQHLHQFPPRPLLPSLTELNASHNNFAAANGLLEYLAPDLRVLRLSNNRLNKFSLLTANQNGDVVTISSLREVDLSYNNLITAPFAIIAPQQPGQSIQQSPDVLFCSHPCLELLDLSFNPDFANATPDIMIGKLPNTSRAIPHGFSQHMAKLRSLSLRHCGLSSLTLSQCPELRELNVSENQLLAFPFIDLATRAQVSAIDISGNKLKTLDALVLIPTTGDAAVGANNVAALFPNLERLDVSNNDLNAIPPRICLFPKLRNMSLSGNPIRTIRRDLLAKNTNELKAYLRSRLDERENDESSLANSKALLVEEAMLEKAQQQCQEQNQIHNQQSVPLSTTTPPQLTTMIMANNSTARNPHQQQQHQQTFLQPIGIRRGNLWDLSRNNGPSPAGSSAADVAGRQSSSAAARASRVGWSAMSTSAENDSIPLLPATLTAACVLEVAPHTQEHVSQCTALSLSGQTRLREISADFFANLLPQLTELDASRTGLVSLKEILGGMNNGAPTQLKTLNASRCSLQGSWPIEWCRPLPGEQQALAHLDISCNGITALPEQFGLAVCWSLRYLNISHNKISHLPQGLLHLRHLTELLYSSNGLVDVSLQLFGDLSQYWPSLNTLDLSFNELRSVHHLPNALGGFSPNVLRALKLEGNGIRFLSTTVVEGPCSGLLAALRDRMIK